MIDEHVEEEDVKGDKHVWEDNNDSISTFIWRGTSMSEKYCYSPSVPFPP